MISKVDRAAVQRRRRSTASEPRGSIMPENRLFQGDNLEVLRRQLADESVDLTYLDPPFNSNRDYFALSGNTHSGISADNSSAFEDRWQWNDLAIETYEELSGEGDDRLSSLLPALKQITGETGLMAYILMLAPRLIQLHRILKPGGSIYLHCDQRAGAYIKLLMDAVFGRDNFLNCIVWCYGLGGSSPRYWPRKHDDILWYSKVVDGHYFRAIKIPATSQRMKGQLKKAPDFWDIPAINNMARERTRYPTQKPVALLERIIQSSSRPGDVVLDPFCGSGTTLVAAERLGRNWIGIDCSPEAIELTRERLARTEQDTFNSSSGEFPNIKVFN